MQTLEVLCVILLVVCVALAVGVAVTCKRLRASRAAQESAGDDLHTDAQHVLAALDAEVIVVDSHDAVVRATPATCRLGLVRDDAIADERLREKLMEARQTGRSCEFELTTLTAQDYAMKGLTPGERLEREQESADAAAAAVAGAAAAGAAGGASAVPSMTVAEAVKSGQFATSTNGGSANSRASAGFQAPAPSQSGGGARFSATPRKNWLRLIVVPVTDRLELVLIVDDSDKHRFEQLRDDFVSNVTTQLDEPAKALEELGAKLSDPNATPQSIHDQAAEVTAEAKYLRHLVSDLIILLGAQGSGAVKDAPVVDLGDVARSVVSEEQPRADAAHVALEFKQEGGVQLVHGNADQLHAAIAKLVENAIEFSPDRSHVSVAVEPDETGDYTQVRVVDNGPGVPEADRDKIFQRFYRGKSQHRVHGGEDGTGLGLSIVKHVALTHQGRVDVWSKPGSGSTFTIVLPKATDAVPGAASNGHYDQVA
ncbi:MAG: HAMP domain-containing sensor histidine kinase [Bifidobacteriaceae bacterium]|nr:HAMP domain-containing sensor histidine kinase [Bifidobacteriaceae bacterium]